MLQSKAPSKVARGYNRRCGRRVSGTVVGWGRWMDGKIMGNNDEENDGRMAGWAFPVM